MTITYPRTDVLSVQFQDQSFTLDERSELGTGASGITIAKLFGSRLWMAEYATVPLEDGVAYEAKLNSLDGPINAFYAGDLRRPYPKAHSNGVFNDTGIINSVINNKTITISGLDAGFTISEGDYFHFDYNGNRALHQALETVTADGAGLTPAFDVRPHLRSGFVVETTPVVFKNPKALFCLVPKSVSPRIHATVFTVVQFKAKQVIS